MSSIDERLTQVNVDINALETEKQKLLDQKKKEEVHVFKEGEVISYQGKKRLVIRYNGTVHAVDGKGCVHNSNLNTQDILDSTWFQTNYKPIGRLKDFLV
jgi:hypothetical protein